MRKGGVMLREILGNAVAFLGLREVSEDWRLADLG